MVCCRRVLHSLLTASWEALRALRLIRVNWMAPTMPEKQCDSMASTDHAKRSHVTNLGEPNGVHFIPKEKCDSMASTDCGKKSHATNPGKADGVHFMPKEPCNSMVDRSCHTGRWSFFWCGKVHTRKEQ